MALKTGCMLEWLVDGAIQGEEVVPGTRFVLARPCKGKWGEWECWMGGAVVTVEVQHALNVKQARFIGHVPDDEMIILEVMHA